MKTLVISILLLFALSNCQHGYDVFDPHLPGLEPELFAEDLIARNGEYVGYCAFSPDGRELYYAITDKHWASSKIIRISSEDITKKDTLHLQSRQYEGEPFISFDNQQLFFMAIMPPVEGEQWHADQYVSQRMGNTWGKPERLGSLVNTSASEWHLSLTKNDVLYFTSEREKGTSALHGDIYRAELVNREIINCTKLVAPINSDFNDSDPLIAPDESFLIFHSDRPGGYGEHDLYISFNLKGKWSDPINMGEKINTKGWEMAPTLTPDGKFFLYTYREKMETDDPAKIYWVSAEILEQLKKQVRVP